MTREGIASDMGFHGSVVHLLFRMEPYGGLQEVVVELALAARQHGYQVAVVALEDARLPNQYVSLLRAAGVAVSFPSWLRIRLLRWSLGTLARFVLVLALVPFAMWKRMSLRSAWQRLQEETSFQLVERQVRRAWAQHCVKALDLLDAHNPVSLVHAHGIGPITFIAAHWADKHDTSLVCHYHGQFTADKVQYYRSKFPAEDLQLLADTATVIVQTPLLYNQARGFFGDTVPIEAIPNWVRVPDYISDKRADRQLVRVGFLSRLVEFKGLEELISAVARVRQRGLDIQCRVGGDGPLRPVCERLAQELGCADHVRFLGAIGRDGIGEFFGGIDAFVLASHSEAMPMSLMEAMSTRTPIIATPVGGIPDMITHGESGLLVPVGDVEALADAIETLAKAPDVRERLGRAGYEKWKAEYTEEAVWPKVAALYEALMAGNAVCDEGK